jgi:D-alanine transfer protein
MARRYINEEVPHLFAALIALGLAVAVLFAGARVVVHLERGSIRSTAPEVFLLKNQGLAFQRAAARAKNVLPIYGSSELLRPSTSERGDNFFRTAPTGFQLSPVGGGGANTLVMLQKVGALGSDLRGKKVAISLSPSWFLTAGVNWEAYKGKFSPMAAIEMVFGTALDLELKRDIASRMLECPSSLENHPILEFALRRLASGRWFDRIILSALWPAGEAEIGLLELQDHLAVLNYIRRQTKPAPQLHVETPDWPRLIAKANSAKPTDAGEGKQVSSFGRQIAPGSRDADFRSRIKASPGWIDLELLLRSLAAVHARPLILSMPLGGDFFDHGGVSRSAREDYYANLRALGQRYDFPVIEFEDHDEDPGFLIRHSPHLTAKGWLYYDRALDDFFHGRMPRS